MDPLEPDDDRELLALERLIRRADGFALAFARVNALPRRRELVGTLRERLGANVRVVTVDVPPETTDIEALLARVYEAEQGRGKVALFVFGVERVLSSVRERNGFLPVLNYKRENLQRSVPCPVVVWLPEFALRLVATGAPDTWAWRSGVFEFAIDRAEADQTWETVRNDRTVDEYVRLTPNERQARIETLETLYHAYTSPGHETEPSQLAIQSNVADRLGRLYREKPDYDTALEWAKCSLSKAENAFGLGRQSTLAPLSNLGTLLRSRGDLDEAKRIYRLAVETAERTLGPDHPNYFKTLNNLGSLLESRGDFGGAEQLFRKALDGCERLLGSDHSATLTALDNLGNLLRARGDAVGAELLLQQALGGRERMLGPEHPATLASVHNLGHLRWALGDLEGAEHLLRRAVDSRERILGPDNPATLASVNGLGAVLGLRGDLDGAEHMLRWAVDGQERVLGPDHQATLTSVNNLGTLLWSRRDLSGAQQLFRRALEGAEHRLGRDHPDTVLHRGNLTALLADLEEAGIEN